MNKSKICELIEPLKKHYLVAEVKEATIDRGYGEGLELILSEKYQSGDNIRILVYPDSRNDWEIALCDAEGATEAVGESKIPQPVINILKSNGFQCDKYMIETIPGRRLRESNVEEICETLVKLTRMTLFAEAFCLGKRHEKSKRLYKDDDSGKWDHRHHL